MRQPIVEQLSASLATEAWLSTLASQSAASCLFSPSLQERSPCMYMAPRTYEHLALNTLSFSRPSNLPQRRSILSLPVLHVQSPPGPHVKWHTSRKLWRPWFGIELRHTQCLSRAMTRGILAAFQSSSNHDLPFLEDGGGIRLRHTDGLRTGTACGEGSSLTTDRPRRLPWHSCRCSSDRRLDQSSKAESV